MLKIKFIVLLIILFVGTKTVFSQGNALKVGLLGAPLGDFSLGIEQLIHSDYTMNINIGYWNSKNGLIDVQNLFNEGQNIWLQNESTAWHGSIEMRKYFSFGQNIKDNKFYWGPYFRFWNYSLLLNDYIKNEFVTQQQLFDVKAKFNGVGVGVQFGYQVMLTERLWLDFYFIGLGVEHVKMKAEYRAVDVANFDYSFIEGDVNAAFSDKARFIKNNVKVWSAAEKLLIELPTYLPGIRAGVNIALTLD
ncbi:MAG: DUF3575 domain-containing protein [Prolixibacteraceae bacterium]|jgi:hypothetical protein|nr:DUF3575 domain-containing protein [Prolixibacteraceae bacterium]